MTTANDGPEAKAAEEIKRVFRVLSHCPQPEDMQPIILRANAEHYIPILETACRICGDGGCQGMCDIGQELLRLDAAQKEGKR